MNETLRSWPIPTNNSWTEVFQKYLNNHHQFQDHPDFFGRLKNTEEIPLAQDIIKSHNHFFNNVFHSLESKRPVHNIYKRPI